MFIFEIKNKNHKFYITITLSPNLLQEGKKSFVPTGQQFNVQVLEGTIRST